MTLKDLGLTAGVVVALVVAISNIGGNTETIREVVKEIAPGFGAVSGNEVQGDFFVYGGLGQKSPIKAIAATSIYSTTTLSHLQSGTIYTLSASGTTITLPAVANKGAFYRFMVGGALDTGNVIIDSAEGDNIEGTLIVAGAVVDCDAEDQINFVTDGENVGDFVDVFSNGVNWVIGANGTLTTAKMTCTDPS